MADIKDCDGLNKQEHDKIQADQNEDTFHQNMDDEFFDMNYEPDVKVRQSLIDKVAGFTSKAINKMTDSNAYLNDKTLDKILDKHFNAPKTRKEEFKLAFKLHNMQKASSDLNYLIDQIASDHIYGIDHQALSKFGRPIKFKQNQSPVLNTLPLPVLRKIAHTVASIEGYQPNDTLFGKWSRNFMYQFKFPKTIAIQMGDAPSAKFAKVLQSWRDKGNAFFNQNMNAQPNLPVNPNDLPRHPETGLPMIGGLTRKEAGFSEIIDFIKKDLHNSLKVHNTNTINYVQDRKEVFEIVSDLLTGKAFIRSDKDNFGEVWMYDTEAPKTFTNKNGIKDFERYKETGDIKIAWRGFRFTEKQEKKLQKNSKTKALPKSYIKPYITKTNQHLKFNAKVKMNRTDTIERSASVVDSLTQHMDVLFKEVLDGVVDQYTTMNQKLENAIKIAKDNGIELPGLIFEGQNDIKGLIESNSEIKDEDYVSKKMKGISKVQIDRTLYDENGNKVRVRQYKRFFPRMYDQAKIPRMMEEASEDLTSQIEELRAEATNPNITPQQRKSIVRQYNEFEKSKANIQKAMNEFRYSDEIFQDQENIFHRPFDKHFKKVTYMFRDEDRRKDEKVIEDYVKHLSKGLSKFYLMSEFANAYVRTKVPYQRKHMLNKYYIATNDDRAEGSTFGIRYSNKGINTLLPFVSEQWVKSAMQNLRHLNVINPLSGLDQGLTQLVAHVNKAMRYGVDKWSEALEDVQREEVTKLLNLKGVLSFMESIENHIMIQADPRERDVYNKEIELLKKKLKKVATKPMGDEKKRAEQIGYIKHTLSKLKKTNHHSMLKRLADWAIDKKIVIYKGDSFEGTKKALNQLHHISIPATEKHIRSVSYMLEANATVESGLASSIWDDTAHQAGLRAMGQMDMFLASENLGDNFGNNLLKISNSVSVWKTQDLSYQFNNLKKILHTNFQLTDKNTSMLKKAFNTFEGGMSVAKQIVNVMLPYASRLGGSAMGAIGGSSATGGDPTATGIGALLGLLGSEKIISKTNISAKAKAERIKNPMGTAAIQEGFLHLSASGIYSLFLFSDLGAQILGANSIYQNASKKLLGNNMAGRAGQGLSRGFYVALISAGALAWKGYSEDEEIEFADYSRMLFALKGWGFMLALNLVFDLLDGKESVKKIMKGTRHYENNFHKKWLNQVVPQAIKDIPYITPVESLDKLLIKLAKEGKSFNERDYRYMLSSPYKFPKGTN